MKAHFNILIYFLSVVSVAAQGTFVPKINSIPSSPEAALMQRYGEIPVSHYTGAPDISIPLYTIKQGGIEIPIILKYQGSGIKVADEATWVGLGWMLEVGGSIMQEVRGKRDDADSYYSNHYLGGSQIEHNTFMSLLNGGDYSTTPQVGTCRQTGAPAPATFPEICNTTTTHPSTVIYDIEHGKGQPDIYHYNLPGFSGSYYVHPETGQRILLDKKAQIFFEHPSSTSITAYGPDGVKYLFQTYEESGISAIEISGRTYRLTKVEFPSTDSPINFSYQNELFTSYYNNASMVYNSTAVSQGSGIHYNGLNATYGNKKRLSQIVTPEITIIFNASSREDFLQNSSNTITKLESIEIRSTVTGKKIKKFNFGYEYFNPSGNQSVKRLKLKTVKEVGYTYFDQPQLEDLSMPGYTFEYNETVSLPEKTSNAVDFWGYFNGATTNSSLIPDLDFFGYRHNPEFMMDGQPGFNYNPAFKANRYANNTTVTAGILQKIKYPTGGHTIFEYEPHSFTNQFIPTQQQFAQMQKTVIRHNGPLYPIGGTALNITMDTEISLSMAITHGWPTGCYVEGTISNIYNNAYIRLTKQTAAGVEEIKKWQAGSYISQANFSTAGGVTFTDTVFIIYEPGTTYSISVYFPYITGCSYTIPLTSIYTQVIANYLDPSTVESTSYAGGVRIASIKSYSAMNDLVFNKEFIYGGGKLLNQFKPLRALPASVHSNFTVIGGSPYWFSFFYKRIDFSTEYLNQSSGNIVGYDNVEEIIWDKFTLQNCGKKRYEFYNQMNLSALGRPTSVDSRNGQLNKETLFDYQNNPKKETSYYYSWLTVPVPYFRGLCTEIQQFGDFDGPTSSSNVSAYVTPFSHKYLFQTYPLISNWNVLTSTNVIENLSGGIVSNLTTYLYNTNGQRKSVTTTSSTGNTLVTNTKYASDYPYNTPIEGTMVNNHILSVPLKTEILHSGSPVSTTRHEFISDLTTVNNVQLKNIYFQKGGSPSLEKRVVYDKYDANGNILQYHLESGVPISIVYGFNSSLPVAKIEGVEYANLGTTVSLIQASTSSSSYSESVLEGHLNQLRMAHPQAMVTCYVYKPGLGVSSIIDVKGLKTSYEYDNFGRLATVRDSNGKLVSENQYHFQIP